MISPPEINPVSSPSTTPRFPWVLFLALVFIPTVLTVLAAHANLKDVTPMLALFGGGASGIGAGILVGRRFGKTDNSRIALSLVFVVVFGVACVTMNCFGCIAGGYKLHFQ